MNQPLYRISDKAKKDLAEIWLYTSDKWSREQADRYYSLLIDEINQVANHFESGKRIDYIKKGYRSVRVKSHFIFYRKAGDGVTEIVRILHQNMDFGKRL